MVALAFTLLIIFGDFLHILAIRSEDAWGQHWYEIQLITSDVPSAGTDAQVSCALYGGKEGAENFLLRFSGAGGVFERNTIAYFNTFNAKNLFPLSRVVLSHDGTGDSPEWHVHKVFVFVQNYPLSSSTKHTFVFNRWILSGKLYTVNASVGPTTELNWYEIRVLTSERLYSGTDANVRFTLYGNREKVSFVFSGKGELLETNRFDQFLGFSEKNACPLWKLGVSLVKSNLGSGFYPYKILVHCKGLHTEQAFYIFRWIYGKEKSATPSANTPSTRVPLKLKVFTTAGYFSGAGSNVYCTIKSSARREQTIYVPLSNGPFVQGGMKNFSIYVPPRLIPVSQITIDNKNKGDWKFSAWHLNKIVVYSPTTGLEQTFPANFWIHGQKRGKLYEDKKLRKTITTRAASPTTN